MNPTLAVNADRNTLRLSDTVPVTVVVEGVAPLRVEVPAELLAGTSADIWRVVPAGAARVEPLPAGRERWAQTYRCSPFQPGDGLPLEFAAFRVTAGPAVEPLPLRDKPLSFTVTTDLLGATAADARPVTGVEELPPAAVSPDGWPVAWAVTAGVMLAVAVGLFAVVRRRKRVAESSPVAEAVAALDAPGMPPDRVAEVIRRFIRRRFGWPTETATTVELLEIAGKNADCPRDWGEELAAILAACDRAKFAAGPPDEGAATETRARARAWVTAVGDAG